MAQVNIETSLEEASASLRASCNDLQQKLDQQSPASTVDPEESASCKASCPQCQKLSEELRISKDRCGQFQRFHLLLEEEVKTLQTQVDDSQAREDLLRDEVKGLEQKLRETVSAGQRLSTGVHLLLRETDVPLVDPAVEQRQVERSTSTPPTEISSQEPQEVLDQCRNKMEDLERENKALKEQCQAAEMEKNTLRTNIRKVSANWFERKTRSSESEEGCPHQDSSETPFGLQALEDQLLRAENMPRLLAEVSFATGKLELTEKMYSEVKKRVGDYENVIDDQEVIIHGLKDQLDMYFEDNQKMSQQLSAFAKLFEDLELAEKTRAGSAEAPDVSLSFSALPSEKDLEAMSGSVSKTYIKLKELIFEKKSLVTEIDRLKVLNVELQKRVTQQEARLASVSGALHGIWMLVSDMREQHAQLHSSESVLRYELREKRQLLRRLREELECSREQWLKIREMNSQSEEAWNTLRAELDERRGARGEPVRGEAAPREAPAGGPSGVEFEPPVDLLLDMAIEYGAMDADDEASTAIVAAIEGQDVHSGRLQELEGECTRLYQKLMASTARSLALASRLTALHDHYGSDEDDDDGESDDGSEGPGPEEGPEGSESSDTAYLSEAESASSEEEVEAAPPAPPPDEEEEAPPDEAADDLSKRLINFLPRKIEMLHRDNQRLEAQYDLLLQERNGLREALREEKRLNGQMEDKLRHLGKCVDELGRGGKISEAEEAASLSQQEKKIKEELDNLRDKYEERGGLLHVVTERVTELETALQASELATKDAVAELNQTNTEASKLQAIHTELNSEHEQLKAEGHTLQQQVADLKCQISSNDMEHADLVKADQEKSEALLNATSRISEQDAQINRLEEAAASQKQLLLIEQDRLSGQVKELTQNLNEQKGHCSCLEEQLQQTETALKESQQSLSELNTQLSTSNEASTQLDQDNGQLREKIIQLLSRRVRVCHDCFSVQAELATLVAAPSSSSCAINNPNDGLNGTLLERETAAVQTTSTTGLPSQQSDCQECAVISEGQSSRLSLSSGTPSTSSDVTDASASEDILTIETLSTSPPTNAEVWVGAGSRVLLPLNLPTGVTLHWNFISEPKNVSFAVLHQPHEDGPDRQRVLIPTTRVASTQGAAVRGRLDTKQPGIYTLVFDNSTSRFTTRKVTYSMSLKNPAEPPLPREASVSMP